MQTEVKTTDHMSQPHAKEPLAIEARDLTVAYAHKPLAAEGYVYSSS